MWCLYLGKRDGSMHRRYFHSREDAEKDLARKRKEREREGAWFALLPDTEKADLYAGYREMKVRGLTIRQLLDTHATLAHPKKSKSLHEALVELLEVKKVANRRHNYIKGLRCYLTSFIAGREELPVDKIHVGDIERWFVERKEMPNTRRASVGRLSSFFSYCERRGYITANPIKKLEAVTIDRGRPDILTLDESRRLLHWCMTREPRALGYFAVALFFGTRPEEIATLTWKDFDLDRKRLTIDKSKVRGDGRWRILELPDNLVEFLKISKDAKGKFKFQHRDRTRLHRGLTKAIFSDKRKAYFAAKWGTRWPHDIVRHTGASYLVALHQDEPKVALMMMTSVGMLRKHYRNLVTPEDARAYFEMTPESIRSG
jgi:integrase